MPEPYPSSGDVHLLAHLQPFEVGGTSLHRGTKPWSYRSPSGREYVLFGGHSGTAFIEVTDPGRPKVIANLAATPGSPWRPSRTYQHYAYITSGSGPDFQIADLSAIDDGTVTLVATIANGVQENTHNLALDETSGFLYRVGLWNVPGLRMYDLSDPEAPLFVGTWAEQTQDAQIVTYEAGPYAGRQIAFACTNEPNSLSIIDVTDKSAPFLVRRVLYPQASVSHQCWLSEDRQWVFLNDEGDSQFGLASRTVVIDVASLEEASYVTSFTNGNPAYTHDAFVRGSSLFCANRTSGLRIFDVSDPLNAFESAWYDTWPVDDSTTFYDLKGVTPFFDSGIVAGTSAQQGLFLWAVGERPFAFGYPEGRPALVDPAGGTPFTVRLTENVPGGLAPGAARLHYETSSTSGSVPLIPNGTDYEAALPTFECGELVRYYVSARATNGFTWCDPPAATTRKERYFATASLSMSTVFADDFETDTGWTTSSPQSALQGCWERAVPSATAWGPAAGFGGTIGSSCWLTDARTSEIPGPGYFDYMVEGGPHELTSPVIDLSTTSDPRVQYARWFANNANEFAIDDMFEVAVTADGNQWIPVESVGLPGSAPGWTKHDIRVLDFIPRSSTFQVRFTVSDASNNSGVEAAIDAFEVFDIDHGVGLPCPSSADCGLSGVRLDTSSLGYSVLAMLTNNSAETLVIPGGCLLRTVFEGDCGSNRILTLDCLGEDQLLPPGERTMISWELQDDSGQSVPDGTYSLEVTYRTTSSNEAYSCCETVEVVATHVDVHRRRGRRSGLHGLPVRQQCAQLGLRVAVSTERERVPSSPPPGSLRSRAIHCGSS